MAKRRDSHDEHDPDRDHTMPDGDRRPLADLDSHQIELLRQEWGYAPPLWHFDFRRAQ